MDASGRRVVALLAALSLAFLMQGCANEVASPAAGQALLLPGQGVIVGALVQDFGDSSPELRKAVIGQSSVSIVVRPAGGGMSDEMSFSTTDKARSTPGLERFTSTERRLLFFRSVPPGDYVVVRRAGLLINSTFNDQDAAKGLHFTVRAGAVTYIGAEIVTSYAKHDWLGITSPGKLGLVLSDDVDNDSIHFYHLHPELRSLPFVDALRSATR